MFSPGYPCVIRWGFSAGAFCAGYQMVIDKGNTEGLFRAVILESGAAFPPGGAAAGQPIYDALVKETGCSNSTSSLDCLASLDLAALTEGINKSPNFLEVCLCLLFTNTRLNRPIRVGIPYGYLGWITIWSRCRPTSSSQTATLPMSRT